ncbi:MAG: hypothetical protein JWO69_533 [Thermoleophilia bacterium]|jgi:hypothetical protein|nr:hypothetical protein [Thermoleophilia bacterium]
MDGVSIGGGVSGVTKYESTSPSLAHRAVFGTMVGAATGMTALSIDSLRRNNWSLTVAPLRKSIPITIAAGLAGAVMGSTLNAHRMAPMPGQELSALP